MLSALRGNKEMTALVVVTLFVIGLVGFVSTTDGDVYEIEDAPEVKVADAEKARVPTAADILAEQKRREAAGLPTGLKKKIDGRSHQHGGYGTTFRVVYADSGTGVSNAVVYFLAQKSVSEIDWTWRREEIVRTQGKRLKTDHWGDVRIQNFQGSAIAMCAHRGKYGEMYIKSFYDVMTKKYELRIEPDYAVKIQVLNPKGRGVKDVPVALWRNNEKAHKATHGAAPRRLLIWTGTTQGSNGVAFARRSLGKKSSAYADDDGWNGPLMAQLHKGEVYATFYFPPLIPQSLFDDVSQPRSQVSVNDASGVTQALLEQTSEVTLTSLGPQCDPLELPQTGSVKLALRQDNGDLYQEPCVVWIGSYSRQREKTLRPNERAIDFDPKLQSISAGSLPLVAKNGIVTLPHVGLFSSFPITVMPMNKSHDAVEMIVDGPTRHKQIRHVDVPLGPERAVIAAELHDGDGQPFAREYVNVVLAIPGVSVNGAAKRHKRIKTDDKGIFEMRVPVEFSLYSELELRITGMKKTAQAYPPYVSKIIKTPTPGAQVKLGVLNLGQRGLICRGRVFGQDGRPLPGARITLLRRPFPPTSKRRDGDGRILALTQAHQVEEEMASFTSNKQGYFTHGGYLYNGTWEMVVSQGEGDETSTERFEFVPGQKNMKVVFEAESSH